MQVMHVYTVKSSEVIHVEHVECNWFYHNCYAYFPFFNIFSWPIFCVFFVFLIILMKFHMYE